MGKSKTNVGARQENKKMKRACKFCGADKPEMVLTFIGGKKQMVRKCCEDAGFKKIKGKYIKV